MFLTRRKSTIMPRVADGGGKKQSVDGVKHTNADRDVSGVERADGAIGEKRGDGGGGDR